MDSRAIIPYDEEANILDEKHSAISYDKAKEKLERLFMHMVPRCDAGALCSPVECRNLAGMDDCSLSASSYVTKLSGLAQWVSHKCDIEVGPDDIEVFLSDDEDQFNYNAGGESNDHGSAAEALISAKEGLQIRSPRAQTAERYNAAGYTKKVWADKYYIDEEENGSLVDRQCPRLDKYAEEELGERVVSRGPELYHSYAERSKSPVCSDASQVLACGSGGERLASGGWESSKVANTTEVHGEDRDDSESKDKEDEQSTCGVEGDDEEEEDEESQALALQVFSFETDRAVAPPKALHKESFIVANRSSSSSKACYSYCKKSTSKSITSGMATKKHEERYGTSGCSVSARSSKVLSKPLEHEHLSGQSACVSQKEARGDQEGHKSDLCDDVPSKSNDKDPPEGKQIALLSLNVAEDMVCTLELAVDERGAKKKTCDGVLKQKNEQKSNQSKSKRLCREIDASTGCFDSQTITSELKSAAQIKEATDTAMKVSEKCADEASYDSRGSTSSQACSMHSENTSWSSSTRKIAAWEELLDKALHFYDSEESKSLNKDNVSVASSSLERRNSALRQEKATVSQEEGTPSRLQMLATGQSSIESVIEQISQVDIGERKKNRENKKEGTSAESHSQSVNTAEYSRSCFHSNHFRIMQAPSHESERKRLEYTQSLEQWSVHSKMSNSVSRCSKTKRISKCRSSPIYLNKQRVGSVKPHKKLLQQQDGRTKASVPLASKDKDLSTGIVKDGKSDVPTDHSSGGRKQRETSDSVRHYREKSGREKKPSEGLKTAEQLDDITVEDGGEALHIQKMPEKQGKIQHEDELSHSTGDPCADKAGERELIDHANARKDHAVVIKYTKTKRRPESPRRQQNLSKAECKSM